MIKLLVLKKKPNSHELKQWVSWLNDKNITKFSEQRFQKHTLKTQINFIKKKIKEKNSLIYKIYYNKNFVGTIEASNINLNHLTCEIGFFIGNKEYWNLGIASYSIKFLCDILKKKINIRLIYTFIYDKNYASIKCLKKNKFKFNSLIKDFYLFKSKDKIRKTNCVVYTKKL